MIKDRVRQELQDLVAETLGPEFSDFEVDHPQNENFGDFTLNVALKASKSLRQPSLTIAKRLSEVITGKSSIFAKAEAVLPGFVNLTLKSDYLLVEINEILSQGENYGSADRLKGKRIAVEYTDPNPFKEFHIGHLYSNIVGEAVARLKEAVGATVWRCDYFGDVGMHVAKSLWGLRRKFDEDRLGLEALAEWELTKRIEYFGRAYSLGATAFEESEAAQAEIKELNGLIFQAAQAVVLPQFGEEPQIDYGSRLKAGKFDFEAIKQLYARGRQWSLEYFETIYQRLGTKFDGYYPESRTGEYGYGMVLEGLKKGIFEKGERGAIIFPGSKQGLHDRVFINALGLPTYETKDFGNAVAKNVDFPYDESVIVTGNEINEYFRVVLAALRRLHPELGERTVHIGHGMVRLPEGKMSSRTGKIIAGEWLLDEAKKRALAIVKEAEKSRPDSTAADFEKIAEMVGQAAVKYALLKNAIGRDIEFDFDESVSFEGNSGPYLQYTYARARSVLRKAQNSDFRDQNQTENSEPFSYYRVPNSKLGSEFSALISELGLEELSLLRTFYKFPEAVESAALNYAPHLLCHFLFDLSQKFNLFYNNVPILNTQKARRVGESDNSEIPMVRGSDDFNIQDSEYSEFSEKTSNFRLVLTAATAQILHNGLRLLGIQSPERM